VLGYNDIDQDDSENTRWAANFDVTWEPAGSWLRTVKAGVKVERSRRKLFEANIMELTGPLTMEEFGVGPFIDPSVVGAPYAPWLSLDIGNLMRWRQYSQSLIDGNPDFVNEYVEDGDIPIDEDSYTSDEDTYAGYVMAKGVWGNWDVVGGVRIDHTRVSSTNWELIELEDEDPGTTA
jgi:outer membrane receptor protein involved in Fe transport